MRTVSRGSVLTWILLAGLALLLTPSAAGAQVACGNTIPPACGGVCPDLYDAAGNVVGSPTCAQPTGKPNCWCVLSKTDPACTIKGKKCHGKCESRYRSADDARHTRNPVKGVCMQIAGAPAGSQCQCVWQFQ